MARRERVTRLKSHNRRRNKNPKLSPFQREQKRSKLANQAPSLRELQNDWNSIPRSQRLVSEYLMQRQANKQARQRRHCETSEEQQEAENYELQSKEQNAEKATLNEQLPLPEEALKQPNTITTTTSSSSSSSSSSSCSSQLLSAKTKAKTKAKETSKSPSNAMCKNKPAKAKPVDSAASLNNEMLDSVAPAVNYDGVILDPTQATIARKKEKKHKKKQLARLEKVKSRLTEMENELSELVQRQSQRKSKRNRHNTDDVDEMQNTKRSKAEILNDKKRQRVDEVFERIHKQISKESNNVNNDNNNNSNNTVKQSTATAIATVIADKAHKSERLSSHMQKHKSSDDNTMHSDISHDTLSVSNDNNNSNNTNKSLSSSKAKDFYELVDVVRYGERVSAPPVFDLVPNEKSAVSTLARKLEAEKLTPHPKKHVIITTNRSSNMNTNKGGDNNMFSTTHMSRFDMLSSMGESGVGNAKRLARLGLASADTNANILSASSSLSSMTHNKQKSNMKEMELLRERVMSAYERNKRNELERRKGVDMKHVFPRFS